MSKRHLILGLGDTGLSIARFLAHQGIDFDVMDSRLMPPGLETAQTHFPNAQYHLGGFDDRVILQADTICVSPGINTHQPLFMRAKDAGIRVVGDIELFIEAAKAPIVGITGTNGKSTVTAWLNHIGQYSKLNIKMGGNIGIPALDLLSDERADFYILELSSFQLDVMTVPGFFAACITNITDDHLDRHGDMASYRRAKQIIYHGANTVVYNVDDPNTYPNSEHENSLGFSIQKTDSDYGIVEKSHRRYLACRQNPFIETQSLQLAGRQNEQNALAVLALANAIGIESDAVKLGLQSFKGLPHRCQRVRTINGVDWINDSKGTNVGATIAAIEGMASHEKLILIAGGQGKGADFTPLAETVKRLCKYVLLFGEDAPRLEQAFEPFEIAYKRVANLTEAIHQANAFAKTGDLVLFSPACASYDMFKNFEMRGKSFEQEVLKLVQHD